MLTAKENFRECIRGGNPDRFVNQYEAVSILFNPFMIFDSPMLRPGMMNVPNAWGVYNSFPENVPGPFPVHTPDKILVKDIEHWRDYVKIPPLHYSDEQWAFAKTFYDQIDGTKSFKAAAFGPGIFEQTHHFCNMQEALANYLMYPDEMHDMIRMLTDWELELAEQICSRLHPDAVMHHDDWGSNARSFMNPDMFAEFFLEPYKEIYGYFHNHGVEVVIHHADSYCANLLPTMIEMGIDVWQGCMESNDVPALVKKYGGQIAFMGNIDNKSVDFEEWTAENCAKQARRAMDDCGLKYFIPCITQGGPGSVYPGVYKALWDSIDDYNRENFGIEDPDSGRIPMIIFD